MNWYFTCCVKNWGLVDLDGYKKGNLGRAEKPHATLANHFVSTMSRYPLPRGTQGVLYNGEPGVEVCSNLPESLLESFIQEFSLS